MEFPGLVYRCPGPYAGPAFGSVGTTYGTRDVADAADLEAALADGWHATLLAAAESSVGLRAAPVEPVEQVPADDAPPTRAEMIEQAARIGLRVDKRWSDETLLNNIVARMREQEQAE